jgi:hypothetical protein
LAGTMVVVADAVIAVVVGTIGVADAIIAVIVGAEEGAVVLAMAAAMVVVAVVLRGVVTLATLPLWLWCWQQG